MLPFKILAVFFRCILSSFFNKKFKIITYPLIWNKSYRIWNKSNHLNSNNINFLLPARYFKHALKLIFKKSKKFHLKNGNKSLLSNDHPSTLQKRFIYFDNINFEKPSLGITREDLFMPGIINKIGCFLILIFMTLVIYPLHLISFKNYKGALSLIILQFFEWVSFLLISRKYKIKIVFDYSCFETDSNILSYLYDLYGIKTYKIPPSVPMESNFEYVYCDTFCTTIPHHKYDIDKYKDNWIFANTLEWPVENYNECIPYLSNNKNKYIYDIGFISSGSFFRQKKGHIFGPLLSSEKSLLNILKSYKKLNKKKSFIIFLHPIERNSERDYNTAVEYYKNILGPENLSFTKLKESPHRYFQNVNTAVSSRSQLNFQTMFCGYKAIFAPINLNKEIIKDSSIRLISAYNKKEVIDLLNQTLPMTEDKFFDKYNLENYHHKAFFDKSIINITV